MRTIVQERARPLQTLADVSLLRVSVRKVTALVLGAVITASGWTWGCVKDTGKDVAGAVVSDYVALRDSVHTLQVQREADEKRRAEDLDWRHRVDEKLDALLSRGRQ
jgi:hypothetical protein